MAQLPSRRAQDTLPCDHTFDPSSINSVKNLLINLASSHPQVLNSIGVSASDYPIALRAAVESMRGQASANMTSKRKFIEAILDYGVKMHEFRSWNFRGTVNRYDYEVELTNNKRVGIEAKGCPDGNNITIWNRPSWAQEFVIWSLCPESMVKPPGKGVWSGIGRLFNDLIDTKHQIVDALIFWDGRCGSPQRVCPKIQGANGLRSKTTDIPSQSGKNDWLPPPCIFMLPGTVPDVRHNPRPAVQTVKNCEFAEVLLRLFNVAPGLQAAAVHDAGVEVRNSATGVERKVTVTSRCWPDGSDRVVEVGWKPASR